MPSGGLQELGSEVKHCTGRYLVHGDPCKGSGGGRAAPRHVKKKGPEERVASVPWNTKGAQAGSRVHLEVECGWSCRQRKPRHTAGDGTQETGGREKPGSPPPC